MNELVKGILFHGTNQLFLDESLKKFKRYQSLPHRRIWVTESADESLGYALANSVQFDSEGIILVIKETDELMKRNDESDDYRGQFEYIKKSEFSPFSIGKVPFDFKWLYDSYEELVPPEGFEEFCIEKTRQLEKVAKDLFPQYNFGGVGGFRDKSGIQYKIPAILNEIGNWFQRK